MSNKDESTICPLGHVFGKQWEDFRDCIKLSYQGGCGDNLFKKCKETYLALGLLIDGQIIGQQKKEIERKPL